MIEERDERLLTEIRAALDVLDPVPERVITAARESYVWRTVDTELAVLAEDSLLAPTAGIRSAGGPRLLTFEAPTLTVVVEVADVGDQRRMLGQLVRPQEARIEVRHRLGTVEVPADPLGRFTVERLPAGPVSLACRVSSGESVVTSWVTI
jgi:hypothetical protein